MKIAWKDLAIAFFLAFLLWYGISGSEKFESQIEVRVDYKGLPSQLVVTDGQVNKVSVRIRASAGQLRTMAGNEYRCSLDLTNVTEGENVIPITVEQLPFIRGIEVVEISPPRAILSVDALVKKTVPLELIISNRKTQLHQVEVTVKPEEVEVSGASSTLNKIHKLEIPFSFAEQYSLGLTELTKVLPLPEGVSSPVNEVTLSIMATPNLKPIKVVKPVAIPVAGKEYTLWATPNKIALSLMVPEHLVKNIATNPDLSVSFSLEEPLTPGSHTLPAHISLPDGAKLIKAEPKTITVIVQKKATPKPASSTSSAKKT